MRSRAKYLAAIGVVAVIVLIAVAALQPHQSDRSMDMPGMSASAVATNQVTIKDYMFEPMTIKVKVGTTVTWTNTDQVHHSVSADQSSSGGPHGPLIGKGEQYKFKFTKAGTYAFHCDPHPYMHGTVIVTE